jgi:hypothetical protein
MYRRFAALAFDLANTAGSSGEKMQLLVMADGWLDLVERARKRPSGNPADDAAEGAYSRQRGPGASKEVAHKLPRAQRRQGDWVVEHHPHLFAILILLSAKGEFTIQAYPKSSLNTCVCRCFDRMLLTGYHFTFPACGHLIKTETGYEHVPIEWQPTL